MTESVRAGQTVSSLVSPCPVSLAWGMRLQALSGPPGAPKRFDGVVWAEEGGPKCTASP